MFASSHESRLDGRDGRVEPVESARVDRRVRAGSTETEEFWKRKAVSDWLVILPGVASAHGDGVWLALLVS